MTPFRTEIALVAALLALVSISTACREPEPMRLEPSATWLLEAPPGAAGNPFELLLFIRAPAGHHVHAYALPELDGIDVVERRILPAAVEGEMGVHREAFIARTRGPGLFRWPASEVRVSNETGDTYALVLDGMELEVPSVLGERAPPRRPRGYRAAPAAPWSSRFGLGFAAGAATIGVLGLLVFRRGRRRRDAAGGDVRVIAAEARSYFGGSGRLRRRLESARDATRRDANAGAAEATVALRHWAADRFLISTHAGASEELRRARPENVDAGLWDAWLDRIAAIEHARFGRFDGVARETAIARSIEAAITFADHLDRPAADARESDPAR